MTQENISADKFIKNRSKLFSLLLPGSAVLISAARQMPRNGSLTFPFRQDSDFFYLTGVRDPGTALLMLPTGEPSAFRSILFIPKPDDHTTRWDGQVITQERAGEISGVEDVMYMADLDAVLRERLVSLENLYTGSQGKAMAAAGVPANEALFREKITAQFPALSLLELAPAMKKIRLIKEPWEVEMIKAAIRLTGDAFIHILKAIRPGMREKEVEAIMAHTFIAGGATGHAFLPIVASGRNGLVLHYSANSGTCRDGELLLMDFGSEWNYYASDISRTIPVNGRYTARQRDLYDANLRMIRQAMPLMVTGKRLDEYNREVGALWEEEHVKLGLYTAAEAEKLRNTQPAWTRYYWHGTSHSIGLDVHDPYDPAETFQAGMVFSCEPGIYVEEEGTGIRIENDILITDDGPVNLSADIPVDPDAIEVIINKG